MKIRLLSLLVFVFITFDLSSQTATLNGSIIEKGTNEPLFGVNVIIHSAADSDDTNDVQLGTTSDFDGKYSIDLNPGNYTVVYNYIGFEEIKKTVKLQAGEIKTINISLGQRAELISEVVVSAGRFEQNLSEVTVSMAVIKPRLIENTNSFNMDQAINQIPGVDVNDQQPSIRSVAGWSYGAGSRVLILMDDLPILSGDAGDVKWSFIPVENISQVEVVKGASSVLFGSSAIGGVINIRSAYPTHEPRTKISYFSGVYGNPKHDNYIWWSREFFTGNDSKFAIPLRDELFYWVKNPMYAGFSFNHSQQFDNLDLSMGGNHFIEEGYRSYNYERRSRFNTNVRYRSEKIQGLAIGANSNFMALDGSDFFMWESDTTPFLQSTQENTVFPRQGFRMNIDPYAYYYAPSGSRYSIRTRYFNIINDFPTDTSKNSATNTFYGEYQYQTKIGEVHTLTAGFVNSYSTVNSNLFGDHFSNNFAAYSQIDADLGRLKLTFGLRGEYFIVDTTQTESMVDITHKGDTILSIPIKPVFRAGANYRLFDHTFLRASVGQGYRFPTIAEKYTDTGLGGVNILPNPEITAENSWSGEVGIKQGFKLPWDWVGYIDYAFFIQDIYNMIEYTFGKFNPETLKPVDLYDFVSPQVFGFQPSNIGNARIVGSEITVSTTGKLGPFQTTIMGGYTYTNPQNRAGEDTTASTPHPVLKYRSKHTVKADIDFETGRITFGMNFIYRSPMVNVDRLFCDQRDPDDVDPLFYNILGMFSEGIMPGYWDYRLNNADKSFLTFDMRAGFKFSEMLRLSLIVKNVMNSDYVWRPGDMIPPRRYEVQLSANF